MAAVALLSIILSIGVAIGVTIFTGSPFTALSTVAIFITFGIGIDVAFFIAGAAHRDDAKHMSNRDRVIRGLRMAGPSIFLTSVTDFAAFASNMLSDVRLASEEWRGTKRRAVRTPAAPPGTLRTPRRGHHQENC